MPPLIECQNVTVYRGNNRVLDRLSFSIDLGEHVAILGPNGCGKSTLIKTLTRECYPITDEGPFTLRILGDDRWEVAALRTSLGIVTNDLVAECTRGMSSDFVEYPRRVTGRDTVLSGFFSSIGIWNRHLVTAEMEHKADSVLAELELTHLARRPLRELSSGEAKRVVIARALVHDPRALVLDEMTNSLDLRATHHLREVVRGIAQRGVTTVLVTHHLDEIIPEVDRVILLQAGRVLGDGPKARMLTTERLSALFGTPIEVRKSGDYYHAW